MCSFFVSQARVQQTTLQRETWEAELLRAREVATAPPTAQHTTRCLICREEVRTLELQQHTQECLLDLVSYTAPTAAKALDDEGLSART